MSNVSSRSVTREPRAERSGVALEVTMLILVPAVIAALLAVFFAPSAPVAVTLTAAALVPSVVAAASLLRRSPRRVTVADRITLIRVGLTGVLAAAAVLIYVEAIDPRSAMLAVVVGVALLLDAVDGAVARRTRSSTTAGARLDMEADAAALLVVSLIVAATVGWWAVAIGAMRYIFVAVGWLRPALRGELGYSLFRRTVAAIQASALWIALLPFLPVLWAAVVTAIALTLLLISFIRDAITLERTARLTAPTPTTTTTSTPHD